ncbi:MAG: radical SAM protein [Magnetococcus sp. YQC-9]
METVEIPRHIAWRIYEDLVVAIDLHAQLLYLLRDEALALWKTVASGYPINCDDASAVELLRRRLIRQKGASRCSASPGEVKIEALDFGVINLWAFRNQIPLSGHIEFTGQCNVRCRHCYCVFPSQKDTIGTEAALHLLDELHDCGTIGLVLTGGEFLMRRDAVEILRHLQKRRFVVRLNTNGTLIDERMVNILAEMDNIFRIHVSLYGARAEVHDAITQSAGSFAKTIRAIHLLHEAGLRLRINSCVMQGNFEGYQDIKTEIGDKLGIPVRFDSVIFPKDDGRPSNMDNLLDDEQHIEFNNFRRLNAGPGEAQKAKLCKAAFSFFAVADDGNVYPCLKMKKHTADSMGNVLRQTFTEIWQSSPVTEEIRRPIRERIRNCAACDLHL